MEITDSNFKETLENNEVVLIDFSAEWCGPCKMLGPVIDDLEKEYGTKAVIGKINVDSNPVTTDEFKVRSIPTVLIFKNGELVEKMAGAQSKASYVERIDFHTNS